MSEFELLAKASACRIYKNADLIVVKEQPGSWIPTARFVLLLISGIPLIFGIVSLVTYFQGFDTNLNMSVAFVVVGSFFGFVYVYLNRYAKNINSLPASEFETICSFDLQYETLLGPFGTKLDSLKNTSIEREFQLTSSSKKLVVHYTNGKILLAKGNPFAGGTSRLEQVFRQFGLMK